MPGNSGGVSASIPTVTELEITLVKASALSYGQNAYPVKRVLLCPSLSRILPVPACCPAVTVDGALC